MKNPFFKRLDKGKKDEKEKLDSNEIARQIAIETVKDTERFFQKVSLMFKNIWRFLTNPSLILNIFKVNKLDRLYENFLRNEHLIKLLSLVVAIIFAISVRYAPNVSERYSVDINGYPLISYYDKERMVIEGDRKSVV